MFHRNPSPAKGKRSIFSVFRDKRGVSALEYSVLAGLVVVGIAAAYQSAGIKGAINGALASVVASLDGTTPMK